MTKQRLAENNISMRHGNNLLDVFSVGMDRCVPELLDFPSGPVLNLGAGKKHIHDTIPLDADRGWKAPSLSTFADGEVAGAYAFHFLEHLTKDEVIGMLRELERVLMPGGSLIALMPLAGCELSFEDLDHKTFWNEATWKNFFNQRYYDGTMPRNWRFRVHTVMIMGLVQRNMAVISQLVRE